MTNHFVDDNHTDTEATMHVRHYGDASPTERGTDETPHPEAFIRTKSGYYVDAL
jgi:hypothetical protein